MKKKLKGKIFIEHTQPLFILIFLIRKIIKILNIKNIIFGISYCIFIYLKYNNKL